MPHECATCGTTFPDGSKEMLSGCPDCGGNKFQFLPAGSTDSLDAGSDEPDDPADLGLVESDDDIIIAEESESELDREDRAQASARSTVVSEDELPQDDPEPVTVNTTDGEQDDAGALDEPDLAELREELNDQFESIKILRPGEYELNLMELYDREERIVALEEDGRYVIDVPSSWHDGEES